jgi:hypothetical protein
MAPPSISDAGASSVTGNPLGVGSGAQQQGVFPVAVVTCELQDWLMARDADCTGSDAAPARPPLVQFEVWRSDPIAGVLVLGDGCSRPFVGWLGLMSALEQGRERLGAAGDQG